MNTVIDVFKNNNATFTLKYYGIGDMATGWDIKEIIENRNEILQYYSINNSNEINGLNQYIDYLVLKKIIELKEIVPYLNKEENQEIFKSILLELDPIYSSIKIGNAIKFINSKIEDIFNSADKFYDLTEVTLELCEKYQKGIHVNVFTYMINNHGYLMLDKYANFQKIFENNDDLFQQLFSEKVINDTIEYRLDTLIEIIISVYKRDRNYLINYLDNANNFIISFGEKIAKLLCNENITLYFITLDRIYKFLKDIKHIKASEFENHIKVAEKLLEIRIKQNDPIFTYEIPSVEIHKQLKSNIPWEFKLLTITHTYQKETDILMSNLNKKPENKKALIDLASTNIPTNDYFTHSHQNFLEILTNVGTTAIIIIMRDKELFDESQSWYSSYLKFIAGQLGYSEIELNDDIIFLYQMLNNIFWSTGTEDEQIQQSLCYGTAMFISAFTEKILRTVYKNIKQKEEYVPFDKATMGELLSSGNEVFKEIFGEYQIKHLRFYFCTDEDKKVGFNYRNRLAHWNSLRIQQLNIQFVCKLLFLMTNVINSIFYYFYEAKGIENR